MPHFRRVPPTAGAYVPPERPQTRASAPAEPETREANRPEKTRKIGLKTLSLHAYEPSFDSICQTLFGKEPNRDDATGRTMVPGINAPDPFKPGRPK